MTEILLDRKALPETLLRLIPTEKVRLQESGGVISLIPIREGGGSGLLGLGAGSKLTTEKFLEYKRQEKEQEDRTFGR